MILQNLKLHFWPSFYIPGFLISNNEICIVLSWLANNVTITSAGPAISNHHQSSLAMCFFYPRVSS